MCLEGTLSIVVTVERIDPRELVIDHRVQSALSQINTLNDDLVSLERLT